MYSESRPPADRPTERATDATSNDMTFLPITNLIRSFLRSPARPASYPPSSLTSPPVRVRAFDPLS